jgi:murein DD-endopeptidase MepM/ murein hydrolase activator NlpD
VRALVPLPADEAATRGTLTIETRDASLRRDIGIADRAFGRELVLLDSANWKRVRDRATIARDARALRQVFAAATADQRWRDSWRDPAAARGKTSPYGVERFYYPASDSSRAIELPAGLRARGVFGTDSAAGKADDVPSWRHAGVDIPAGAGTAVRAPAAAVVADVGDYILTGRTLVLDHGQGVYSAYFHLDTTLVRRGDLVKQGASVARVGGTGLATGPHLHFGVYVAGRDVDPAEWRKAVEWMGRTEGDRGTRKSGSRSNE